VSPIAGTGTSPITPVPIVNADLSALPHYLAAPRRRPTQVVPGLRPLVVGLYRLRRWISWHTSGVRFARTRQDRDLPATVHAHASPLLRTLGASQMWLQHNKVTNLRLAAAKLDGVLIRPGETLSVCRLVGRTTRRLGYVAGMMLESGQTVPGVGGGICQISNVLHWMVLHSPLTVTQRSTHSEDPFPDDGRTVPWGTGCTIFYNYVDLQVRNDTPMTFQVRLRVGDDHLEGQLRADTEPPERYRVYARDECFLRVGDTYFRRNEIWRDITDRAGHTRSELVKTNIARTLYPVQDPPTDTSGSSVRPVGPTSM
jgi:vancomycin resistance protein VanW